MKYSVVRNSDSFILLGNIDSISSNYSHNFSSENVTYSINLFPETEDEKRSSRIRKYYFEVIEDISIVHIKKLKEDFNRYNHMIETMSAQMVQKLQGYFADQDWYDQDYNSTLQNISEIIKNNMPATSGLIHYFNKMALDLRSHLEGWSIIYVKSIYDPKFVEVSLRRAILNQLASFSEEFQELGIKIKFTEYFTNSHTAKVDKKLFSLIMYNFFSNALKYSRPNEEIRFNYYENTSTLDVSMYSVKIEKAELEKLFTDGYRGINSNLVSSSGSGSGLFVIKKSLELMNMPNMYIDCDYSKLKKDGEVVYCENHFKFNFSINEN